MSMAKILMQNGFTVQTRSLMKHFQAGVNSKKNQSGQVNSGKVVYIFSPKTYNLFEELIEHEVNRSLHKFNIIFTK